MPNNKQINYNNKSVILMYTGIGVLFGACFPIGAIVLESIIQGVSISIPTIQILHQNNPLLYMIDTAPIFLGLFAMIGGFGRAKAGKANHKMSGLLEEVNQKNSENQALIEKFNQELTVNEEMRKDIENAGSMLIGTSCNLSQAMSLISDLGIEVNDEAANMNGHVQEVNAISETMVHKFDEFNTNTETMHKSMLETQTIIQGHVSVSNHMVEDVQALVTHLNELAHVSKDVESITEIIQRISEDIKLLALNASIEASRAGEAGKGFAVVASEIQKLSGQTDQAVARIANSVNAVTNGVYNAVDEMNGISEKGKHLKETSSEAEGHIDVLKQLILSIKEASSEITQQIGQQGTSMEQIHTMAENLSDHAQSLKGYLEDSKSVINENEGHIVALQEHINL